MKAASSSSPSSLLSVSRNPYLPPPVSFRTQLSPDVRRKPRFYSPICLASSSSPPITNRESEIELENRKFELLRSVTDTQRGLAATPDQRSSIEEALVNVESLDAGKAVELDLLDGTWRLQYTSASDVLILFQSAAALPFFEGTRCGSPNAECAMQLKFGYTYVCGDEDLKNGNLHLLPLRHVPYERLRGSLYVLATLISAPKKKVCEPAAPIAEVDQIFQKFECRDQSGQGVVRNVVRWSIPQVLEEQEGATLIVSAKFSVVSSHSIYLEFEEIAVQNINISEEFQALLAPAILPRSFLSLQILQFIKSFKAQVPVTNSQRRSVGGLYYLSYLDRNMLLGRAVGGGGVFVFTRAQSFL